MKLYELLNAQAPLRKLTEKNFSNYGILRELARLRKAVDAEVEFYTEQEKKAINEYADKDENGQPIFVSGGHLKLKDTAAKAAFEEEITKLRDVEITDISKVAIKETDFHTNEDYPTPDDMIALECVIDFE